jgi:hypothetical protein
MKSKFFQNNLENIEVLVILMKVEAFRELQEYLRNLNIFFKIPGFWKNF